MAASETYEKGRELRRQLLGDAYVERVNQTAYADPIMKKFIDVATETVFGALWTRPGLDLKTRTLICVVSDAATHRAHDAGVLVAEHQRRFPGEEPLRRVDVGAADAGGVDGDHDLTRPGDGLGHLVEGESALALPGRDSHVSTSSLRRCVGELDSHGHAPFGLR